jgi:apolipoprotein N-acyltransferase
MVTSPKEIKYSLSPKDSPRSAFALAGLLLGFGFAYEPLWFVSFFGLALFFYICSQKDFFQNTNLQTFLYGWIFGFGFIGLVILWFWEAYPLGQIAKSESFVVGVIFLAWLIATTTMSSVFGLMTLLITLTKRIKAFHVVIIPIAWVLLEYIRMWIFSLVTVSEESLLGAHFSVGSVGYLLGSHSILLQFASVGGVYLLGFVFVLISFALSQFFQNRFSNNREVVLGIVVFIVLIVVSDLAGSLALRSIDRAEENTELVNIALVNTYFSSEERTFAQAYGDDYLALKILLENSKEMLADVDIIIFPENTNFVERVQIKEESFLSSLFKEEVLFIDSKPIVESSTRVTSTAYTLTLSDGIETFYEKKFLVPLGEYTPDIFRHIFDTTDNISDTGTHVEKTGFSKGSLDKPLSYKELGLKIRFCSDVLSPGMYKQSADEDVDLLVNLSSHAFIHGSKSAYGQVLNMAKVQAVSNKKPFVQTTNGAPSFVLSKNGLVIEESKRGNHSIIITSVRISP